MESTLRNPALFAVPVTPKAAAIAYWTVTALFCLEMSFTAYYMLLPAGAQAIARLGFPAYFRVELVWAKFAGVAALLLPVLPARLKEWVYAGFAINLVSALVAHFSIGDRPLSFVPSTLTTVLLALSYCLWRRLQATPAHA